MNIMGTILNRLYSDYLMPSRLRHYDALLQQARHEGYRQTSVRAWLCLLYTSPSPRDGLLSRMPSSA